MAIKVIIIGASNSGLFAAYLLPKGGIDVEVYERMNALGSPSRTLIVTGIIIEILGFIPEKPLPIRWNTWSFFQKKGQQESPCVGRT